MIFINSCIPHSYKINIKGDLTGSNPVFAYDLTEKQITESPEIKIIFNEASYETKKSLIVDRLKYNRVPDSDIPTFIGIFELESCRGKSGADCFNTGKTPKTTVYHCQRPNGSKVAVEVTRRNGITVQATCEDFGYKRTYEEKSWGLAQILETTWRGYKCEGDIKTSTYEQQVDCAVKIQRTSSWNAWSTYKLLNK